MPAEGTRHLTMLRLAGDLRYICENDPVRLKQWVMLAPFVQDIVRERGEDEVTHACEDVCDRKLYMSIPRNFNAILEQLGATKALPSRSGGAGGGYPPPFGGTEGGVLLATPSAAACPTLRRGLLADGGREQAGGGVRGRGYVLHADDALLV